MVDQTKKSEMITNLFQGCSEVLADAQDAGLDMDQVSHHCHRAPAMPHVSQAAVST